MVATGLQGNIESRPAYIFVSILDGADLSVNIPIASMIATTDYLAISYDQCTDHRIGASFSQPPSGQAQSFPHVVLVIQFQFDLTSFKTITDFSYQSPFKLCSVYLLGIIRQPKRLLVKLAVSKEEPWLDCERTGAPDSLDTRLALCYFFRWLCRR